MWWVSVKAKKDRWIDDDSKTFNVDIEINNLKTKDVSIQLKTKVLLDL